MKRFKYFFIFAISLLLISNIFTITLLFKKNTEYSNIEYSNYVPDSKTTTSELQQDKEKLIEELRIQISELYKVSDELGRFSTELSELAFMVNVIFDELGEVSQEYSSNALGRVVVELDTGTDKLSEYSYEHFTILDEVSTILGQLFRE